MAAVAVSSWCQAHPSDSRTEEGGQSHFLSFGVTGGCIILDRQARLAGEVGTLPQYTCLFREVTAGKCGENRLARQGTCKVKVVSAREITRFCLKFGKECVERITLSAGKESGDMV